MKSETRNALTVEEADHRSRGTALTAQADRIRDLLRADSLLNEPVVTEVVTLSNTSGNSAPVRFSRQGLITQTEGAIAALKILGRPAHVADIFATIRAHGIPAKIGNLDSFRSVMSRSADFNSNGMGYWRLNPERFDISGDRLAVNGHTPSNLAEVNGTEKGGENGQGHHAPPSDRPGVTSTG